MPGLSVAPPGPNSREVEFILLCARRGAVERAGRIRAALQGNLNWTFIDRCVRRTGVLPLVYAAVRDAGAAEWLPDTLRREWHGAFLSNAFRGLRLSHELIRLLSALEDEGLRPIPYKGPVLAHRRLGGVWFREFIDLDLLFPEGEADRARVILERRGYTLFQGEEEGELDPKAHVMARSDGNVIVELHWNLTGATNFVASPLPIAGLWDRSQPSTFMGRTVRGLDSTDEFLCLSVHAAKDLWCRLSAIADVAAVMSQEPTPDWNEILERARRAGLMRIVLLTARLAHRLLDAPLPQNVREKASTRALDRMEAITAARMLSDVDDRRHPAVVYPLIARLRERPIDRARVIFRMIQIQLRPSRLDRQLSLPRPLRALYYLIRPFRLFVQHGLDPLRRLRDAAHRR